MSPEIRARNLKAVAPYREFDAEENLDAIATNSKGRIFVITDPEDVHAPLSGQTGFVDLMRARGVKVFQIIVRASDRDHHDVIPFSMRTIYGCVNGRPTEAITRRGR